MRKPVLLLSVALALMGCLADGQSDPSNRAIPSSPSTPSAEATGSLPEGCAGESLDTAALIAATQGDDVQPVACYGDGPLTFEANWVGGGVADCPAAPEPAWLACSAFSLRAAGDIRKVGAPQLFVAIDPAIGTMPDSGSDVVVTGHFDDPAAQTCHDTGSPPGESPAPVAETIQRCRNTFVISEVTPK